jgi:plasmid stability protein
MGATPVLAFCDMRTLYLRNVPDDVVERLERLAARDATSVSAVAVRELADVSRRADNPALLGALPDLGVPIADLVGAVDAERAGR